MSRRRRTQKRKRLYALSCDCGAHWPTGELPALTAAWRDHLTETGIELGHAAAVWPLPRGAGQGDDDGDEAALGDMRRVSGDGAGGAGPVRPLLVEHTAGGAIGAPADDGDGSGGERPRTGRGSGRQGPAVNTAIQRPETCPRCSGRVAQEREVGGTCDLFCLSCGWRKLLDTAGVPVIPAAYNERGAARLPAQPATARKRRLSGWERRRLAQQRATASATAAAEAKGT